MDFFGERWARHTERIAEAWRAVVGPEDLVLVPGDISWALNLQEAEADLAFLAALPGQKLLLRGNHDYWWSSLSKIRALCAARGWDSLDFLQNDARRYGQTVICGSRLWLLPNDSRATAEDRKIYARELERLKLSLKAAEDLREPGDRLIAMLHYPPFDKEFHENELTAMLAAAGVEACVFGHIHNSRTPYQIANVAVGPIAYSLVAADQLAFCPFLVAESVAAGPRYSQAEPDPYAWKRAEQRGTTMIKSMTAFGRYREQNEQEQLSCEIKSVNHRFLECNLRLPRAFQAYESRVRQRLSERLSRGKVELRLSYSNFTAGDEVVRLDPAQAKAWLAALTELRELSGSTGDLLPLLAARSELFITENCEIDRERIEALIDRAMDGALTAFEAMRSQEGAALAKDLLEGLAAIEALVARIAERAPLLPGLYAERLQERVEKMLGEVREEYYNGQRIAAEVAIFADKADIHEELVRLTSHIAQFRSILEENTPVGKKLDFLIQEMNREANTIGSKANDLQITQEVLNLKSLIEKLREQIQNVE